MRQQDVELATKQWVRWRRHQSKPAAVLSKIYKALKYESKYGSFVIYRILDAGDDIVILGHF
jgi:hypothetical protein